MKKTVIFAFRGDPMCFIHVLLNSLDLAAKGMDGRIVVEGEAVNILPEIAQPGHFLSQLFNQAKEKDLFIGACRACSTKLGAADAIRQLGIPLIGDMAGHPAMADYLGLDYSIITL